MTAYHWQLVFKLAILFSLKMIHLYRNMWETRLWYLYTINNVHLDGEINWVLCDLGYTGLRTQDLTTINCCEEHFILTEEQVEQYTNCKECVEWDLYCAWDVYMPMKASAPVLNTPRIATPGWSTKVLYLLTTLSLKY
jgi:hypothetical protein